MKRETQTVFSYAWKELECELCKTTFPHSVEVKGKMLNLLQYIIPDDEINYMILESVTVTNNKTIHVVTMPITNMILKIVTKLSLHIRVGLRMQISG
jgi:hypothetical protein